MRSSSLLFSIFISVSLAKIHIVVPFVEKSGKLDSLLRHKPNVPDDDSDHILSKLSTRSPVESTEQGSNTGKSAPIPEHGNRMIANALQGVGEKLQAQQKQARKKQMNFADAASNAYAKMNSDQHQLINLLMKGQPRRKSAKAYKDSMKSVERHMDDQQRSRDLNSIHLHKQYQIEQKSGMAIKRISMLGAGMAQRMHKSFPPLEWSGTPVSEGLAKWRKFGGQVKKHYDDSSLKKGGVYLPPRETNRGWKGGLDGHGAITKFWKNTVQIYGQQFSPQYQRRGRRAKGSGEQKGVAHIGANDGQKGRAASEGAPVGKGGGRVGGKGGGGRVRDVGEGRGVGGGKVAGGGKGGQRDRGHGRPG